MRVQRHFQVFKKILILGIAGVVFLGLLLYLPENITWSERVTIAVMVLGVILWAFEPIPLGMTSVLIIVLLLLLHAVPVEIALSGFASPAVFLIIAGMIIANGVNQTTLMDRITFTILTKWGRSSRSIFIGLFLLMQLQAFFIPATAVRIQLMLPVVVSILDEIGVKEGSNFSKLLLIGSSFAVTISGTAILTAAIGNILAVEIINVYIGSTISYFDWFLYAAPIWILLILIIPPMFLKLYPSENYRFHKLQQKMREKKDALGPLNKNEKKCLKILFLTVVLWILEPIHGFHPTIPALLAVVLMGFPGIGFTDWKKIVQVNFDLVLLIGATLSLGFTLIESGVIDLFTNLFTASFIIELFSNPWLAIVFVVLISQIYHLFITNVSTAVVTLLPVLIGLTIQVGMDPVVICLASAITLLFGFILVVETMPNVIVHATGLVKQRDFYVPGVIGTVLSALVTIFVAFTWWHMLGFWP